MTFAFNYKWLEDVQEETAKMVEDSKILKAYCKETDGPERAVDFLAGKSKWTVQQARRGKELFLDIHICSAGNLGLEFWKELIHSMNTLPGYIPVEKEHFCGSLEWLSWLGVSKWEIWSWQALSLLLKNINFHLRPVQSPWWEDHVWA